MKKQKKIKNYFSLVELMVVITIIGLLSGIVALNVFKHVAEAKITTTRTSISEYGKAVKFFYMHTGKYPATLSELYVKPEGVKGWKGPYTEKDIQMDSWHNPFVLVVNSGDKNTPFQIYSFGPDGAEGGEDDIYESEESEGGSSSSSSGTGASETPEPTDKN